MSEGTVIFLYLSSRNTVDWSSAEGCRSLTAVLFKFHFNLSVILPENRLVPGITNRFHYIKWIESLLLMTKSHPSWCQFIGDDVVGGDIGAGASCVFPLIFANLFPTLKMVATEVDPFSHDVALENVYRNQMQDQIELVLNENPSVVLPPLFSSSHDRFDFMMCNPPFYRLDEKVEKRGDRCLDASSVELATEGGEERFISQMVEESTELSKKVCVGKNWWLSLILLLLLGDLVHIDDGQKGDSIQSCNKASASESNNCNWNSVSGLHFQLTQGKTTRWVVAWSFLIKLPSLESLPLPDGPYVMKSSQDFNCPSMAATLKTVVKRITK